MPHETGTLPRTFAGASLLRNRFLQAAALALVAGLALASPAAALGAGAAWLAARAIHDRLTRPAPPSLAAALGSPLAERGADFTSLSECDGKAIGYDVGRRTILFGIRAKDGSVAVTEHGLDAVRGVDWRIEEPDQANVYGVGPAALAGAVQAASLNATARRQALMRSGLRIELADVAVPLLHICLDADETRLRRWTEILTQAGEGTLAKPEARTIV